MYEIKLVVEGGWFSEEYIVGVGFEVEKLNTFEPYALYGLLKLVGEVGGESFVFSVADSLEVGELSDDLDVCVGVLYVLNVIEFGSVDIFIWKDIEQVESGVDMQFFFEELCFSGSDSRDVCYVFFG